jgi:CheY-like chemotaxis protein
MMARLLVVEDDTDTRRLIRKRLEGDGHAVDEAASVAAALAALRSGRPYHLVLCDIFLPGAPGWDLMRAMAADPALCNIPVLVVSITEADDTPDDVAVAGWIVKPFTRHQLLDGVDGVLLAGGVDGPLPGPPIPPDTGAVERAGDDG